MEYHSGGTTTNNKREATLLPEHASGASQCPPYFSDPRSLMSSR